jgi:branched-chain amino acid transport system substrate-binding protein
MRRLIVRDGAVAVLGPSLSIVALQADPVANTLRTPVVAVSNTANGIVGKCAYPCAWIWRDSLGEAVAVPANVDAYVRAANPSTAAVLATDNDVLGADEAQIATSSFVSDGVRVVANVRIPPLYVDSDTIDPFVAKAIKGKPKVLFLGSSSGSIVAQMIRSARADGYTGAILGGNTMNSLTTTHAAGVPGAGARSGAAWYAANDFPANVAFMTAYARAYGKDADQFAAQAYTGVEILAAALAASPPAPGEPAASVRAGIQAELKNVALTTPLGPFRFTANHDVEQIVWILAMNGRGGHDLADFCNPGC